jgi:hypothetical protein
MRLGVVLLLALAGAASAKPVELKWKWKADETFYVQTVTRVKQTLVVEDPRGDPDRPGAPRRTDRDRELRQDYEHISWVRYTVTRVNPDGSAVLKQTVVADRTAVKGPEVTKDDRTFDGVELTLHVDAHGKVTKVEGADKLLDKLAAGDTTRREAMREKVSEESLRKSATRTLNLMPDAPVEVGETWKRSDELKLGAMGSATTERVYKLEKVEDRGATRYASVSFVNRVTGYRPAADGDLALRIADGTLSESSGKGTVEIDMDAGRPSEATTSLSLSGTFTFRNREETFRTRLTQEQTVTVKVTDRLPPKEQPKKTDK